jgi:hypothetical protein
LDKNLVNNGGSRHGNGKEDKNDQLYSVGVDAVGTHGAGQQSGPTRCISIKTVGYKHSCTGKYIFYGFNVLIRLKTQKHVKLFILCIKHEI